MADFYVPSFKTYSASRKKKDEDDPDALFSSSSDDGSSSAATGKTSSDGFYVPSAKGYVSRYDANENQRTLDALAQQEKAKAAEDNKPWYQKVGDFAAKTAKDTVDRTLDVTNTIGEGIAGVQTQAKTDTNTKDLDAATKRVNSIINETKDENDPKWDNPDFKKRLADAQANLSTYQQKAKDLKGEYQSNNFKNRDAGKTAAEFGETALDIGTLGVGGITRNVGKGLIKEGIEEAGKQATKQTVKGLAGDIGKSAAIGGAYGGLDTTRTDPNADFGDYAGNIASGAALGGGFELGGKIVGQAFRSARGKISGSKAAQEATEDAEDLAAREKANSATSTTTAPTAAPTPSQAPKTLDNLADDPKKEYDYTPEDTGTPSDGPASFHDQYVNEAVASAKNAKEYRDDIVDSILEQNKSQGVEIVDGKRISNNTPFYRAFYEKYGRAPSKKNIGDMVDQVLTGKDGEYDTSLFDAHLDPEELAAHQDAYSQLLDRDAAQARQLDDTVPGQAPAADPNVSRENLAKAGVKTFAPLDDDTAVKVDNLIQGSNSSPAKDGFTRLYQGTEGNLGSDQYFKDPAELANYFNGRGESVNLRSVDVPNSAVQDVPGKPSVFRVADDVDAQGNSVPVDKVGSAVENVASPAGTTAADPGMGESRYTSKTIPDSEFVGDEVSDRVSNSYQKVSNAQRADRSLEQLDIEGIDDFSTKITGRLEKKNVTDQTVFDAQAAAQALEKRGSEADLQKAADIYSKLAGHLSKAGQVIQAAAIMARQTPQGLRYYAQRQFEKAGVDFTPDLQKELNGLIDNVKSAKPKTDEAAIARDNVQYFIAQNIPSTFQDRVVNFWRAGLLTGPQTLGGALLGNAAQAVQRNLYVNPIAAMADWTQALVTKKRGFTLAKPGEQIKGAVEGAKNAGSKQYWKTGFDPSSAGDSKFERNNMINYGKSPLGVVTGRYVNGVYQVMGAADQPFRQAATRQALSSLARAEVKNQKLRGKEAKDFYSDFMANPPQEAAERAAQEGGRETFANDTALYKAIQGAKSKLKADGHNTAAAFIDYLVPFSRVPSAVATRIIDSTPLGIGKEIVKQVYNVRKGGAYDQRAMSKAIGEGTLAVPILAAGYALAQNGDITGGYPSDKEERDLWTQQGKQPNSVRIGDRWYSLNYIQPFGTIMALGAGIAEAKQSGADTGGIVSQALASGGKAFINQSFLQGISSGLDAVNNPAQFAQQYVANTASGIIPNAIRAGARAADPLQRQTEGFGEGILSGIPGLREGLPAKLDSNNNPIPSKDNFANSYLNPLKPSQVRDDANADFYDKAVLPAARLQDNRKKEIDDLISKNRVSAAQRKIDEYNQEVAQFIGPYVAEHKDTLTNGQVDRLHKLFMGDVSINKKGRPYVSSTDVDNGL